ncbi:hypothetical protein CDD82_1930 [Ophiocordyceps australis]|uniref:Uncharacterized protein n=1 Tax=Ophiocordyceps australis TaxID=1399860 RepID=A0A2C5Y808_9HYPO|nr:hypothetical protein CDD82_1930 [Ophiocordyceps australis]
MVRFRAVHGSRWSNSTWPPVRSGLDASMGIPPNYSPNPSVATSIPPLVKSITFTPHPYQHPPPHASPPNPHPRPPHPHPHPHRHPAYPYPQAPCHQPPSNAPVRASLPAPPAPCPPPMSWAGSTASGSPEHVSMSTRPDAETPVSARPQSKTPTEEALDDMQASDKDGSPSPARVSLPPVSPPRFQEDASTQNTNEAALDVTPTAKDQSPPCQSPKKACPPVATGSPKHKTSSEIHHADPKSATSEAKCNATRSESCAAKQSLNNSQGEQPTTSAETPVKAAAETTVFSDAITTAPSVTASQPHEPKRVVGHQRPSLSIFTDEQIKTRRQTWQRIPMPLDPRKLKKSPSVSLIDQASTILTVTAESTTKDDSKAAPIHDKAALSRPDGQLTKSTSQKGQRIEQDSQEATTEDTKAKQTATGPEHGQGTIRKKNKNKKKAKRANLCASATQQDTEPPHETFPNKEWPTVPEANSWVKMQRGEAPVANKARNEDPYTYRANAGGSLSMPKKRRGRTPLPDTQVVASTTGHGAAQADKGSRRQSGLKTTVVVPVKEKLNPLATTFVTKE